jgi:hypothetical protein
MAERAMSESVESGVRSALTRRNVVKGAAWAVPVITVAGTPAFAIGSPVPDLALEGWVVVGKDCNLGNDTLTINGTGGNGASPPNTGTRGIWIFAPAPAAQWTITNPRITFYYPSSLGTLTWSTATGNANWSAPVVTVGVDPPIAGYTAYTTYYSGTWTFFDLPGTDNDYFLADGRPNFVESVNISDCGNDLTVYARRTVTVNGNVITFIRSVTLD